MTYGDLYRDLLGEELFNEKTELTNRIKTFREPPFDEDDPYFQRSPWNRLAIVTPGFYVTWREDTAFFNTPVQELKLAIKLLEKYGKRSEDK